MSEKDGGSAFPLEVDGWAHYGMTLRDYFAAQAIPRLLGLALQLEANGKLEKDAPQTCARLAYLLADAMLSERS